MGTMNDRGLITIARDNLRARVWNPLFAGWGEKAIRYDGSHDGLLAHINMAMALDGTIMSPDNPIAQIKANKRTIHASVKLISSALAMTPLRVYKPKRNGEKSYYKRTTVREVPEAQKEYMYAKATPGSLMAMSEDVEEITGGHMAVDLLRNVNGVIDAFALKALTAMYLPITGDCYWVLLKNKVGIPTAIWMASSEYMRPIPDENTMIGGYKYKQGNMKPLIFAPDEVVHFMLPAPGVAYQFHGRGDTAGAADPFNLSELVQQFDMGVFKNKAFLGGLLSTTTRHSPEKQKKLKEDFDRGKAGVSKAGDLMVMENVTYTPLMMTPRELDYQSSRKTLQDEILNNMGVPRAMMDGQVSTRAGLEASLTQFAMYSTAPLTHLIGEALNAQLAPLYPEPIIYAFDNPIMEDKAFQLKEDSIYLKYGVFVPDDVRRRKGMDELGGLSGEPWVDNSRRPISMIGQETEDTDDAQMAARVNNILSLAREQKRARA